MIFFYLLKLCPNDFRIFLILIVQSLLVCIKVFDFCNFYDRTRDNSMLKHSKWLKIEITYRKFVISLLIEIVFSEDFSCSHQNFTNYFSTEI